MKANDFTNLTDSEREYQNKVLGWFDELGYQYLGHWVYPKDKNHRADGQQNGPVLWDRLETFLKDKQHYTDFQIAEIRRQVSSYLSLPNKNPKSLNENNCALYRLMVEGIKAKPSQDKFEEDTYLFDFKNFKNNDFYIAEEVSFIDPLTNSNCRPDLVVYINGIAISVIELKSCKVSIEQAIKQNLSNERDLIPSFFTTTQFTVAANQEAGFKYATILTPLKFWCNWKKDKQEVGHPLNDEESFRLFFDKDTIMQLLRYGVICDGGIKKVMRPHQLHALNAAIPRLQQKASGVIWHSQGSGKSLTMIWLAKYIQANFVNPRVIVLTDRTELDLQITSGFSDAGEKPVRATSGDDLLSLLNGGENWLICSLIHKFGRHIDPQTGEEVVGEDDVPIRLDKYLDELRSIIASKYPNNSFGVKGENIFVFIDECHRTQGGKLHEAMKEIMGKEVMLIGFTGTPLLKEQKKNAYKDFAVISEVKFGTFIHTYLHKEAIDDKVILDLQYETRDVEQSIGSKEKLDAKKDEITKGLTKERKQMVEDRWATLEKVYSSRERIERIGYSILDDVATQMLKHDWCNAMLVAGDVYSAYKYYEFFQNTCTNTLLRGRCAVVTSYNPSDYDLRKETTTTEAQTRNQFKNVMAKQSYADAGVKTAEEYEKWAKQLFIKQPASMKLLIVVDKLLTGFDAPCATYLYIDKEMKDHALFQSLCRVNRLGVDVQDAQGNTILTRKEYGLIVDFKHLFGDIQNAISTFNNENGALSNFDGGDLEGLLIETIRKNKQRLENRKEIFESLKGDWEAKGLLVSGNAEQTRQNLSEYYLKDRKTTDGETIAAKEVRKVLYKITGDFVAGYDSLADFMGKAGYTTEESDQIEALAKEAASISAYIKQQSGDDFDPRIYDPQMRALLDQYIRAEDAEVIVPATAEFSFLDLIDEDSDAGSVWEKTKKKTGSDKGAASIIEGNARAVINSYKERDPELYVQFSTRLEELLKEKSKLTASFVETITKIIELIKQAKNGGNNYPENIHSSFAKALYNNVAQWTGEPDELKRIHTIIDIETFIDREAFAEWYDPSTPDGINLLDGLRQWLSSYTEEQIQNIYHLAQQNLQ